MTGTIWESTTYRFLWWNLMDDYSDLLFIIPGKCLFSGMVTYVSGLEAISMWTFCYKPHTDVRMCMGQSCWGDGGDVSRMLAMELVTCPAVKPGNEASLIGFPLQHGSLNDTILMHHDMWVCLNMWIPQIQWVIIISKLKDHLVTWPLFKPKCFQCWLLWSPWWLRPEVASWCDVVATPCQDLDPALGTGGMEQGKGMEQGDSYGFIRESIVTWYHMLLAMAILRFRESFKTFGQC